MRRLTGKVRLRTRSFARRDIARVNARFAASGLRLHVPLFIMKKRFVAEASRRGLAPNVLTDRGLEYLETVNRLHLFLLGPKSWEVVNDVASSPPPVTDE